MKTETDVTKRVLIEFLQVDVPDSVLDHGIQLSQATLLSKADVASLLPEKGPFLFFADMPVVFVETSEGMFILAAMEVKPEFCQGHFEGFLNLPLYFVGGAAGQLCAMYTTFTSDDESLISLATDGSAKSLGKHPVEVGSVLLFVVRLTETTKRGFEFSYEVHNNNNGEKIASGEVGSIAVPKRLILKNKK